MTSDEAGNDKYTLCKSVLHQVLLYKYSDIDFFFNFAIMLYIAL